MSNQMSDTTLSIGTIRHILRREWDPIGIGDLPGADDEYDSYASDIFRLLLSGASKSALLDYLWHLETVHMGLSGDMGKAAATAEKLKELAVSRNA